MEAVNIFFRTYFVKDLLLIKMRGEWELDQDATDPWVQLHAADNFIDLILGNVFLQMRSHVFDAHLLAGLFFEANI